MLQPLAGLDKALLLKRKQLDNNRQKLKLKQIKSLHRTRLKIDRAVMKII